MLKRLSIIIFFIFSSLHLFSQGKWEFTHASLLYSRIIQYENKNSNNFEIQLDHGCKECWVIPLYYGVSAGMTYNLKYTEFSGKVFYNIASFSLGLSNKMRVFPFLYAQRLYKSYKEIPQTTWLTRYGLGISGVIFTKEVYTFRSGLHVGYAINQKQLLRSQRFQYEIKIGVSYRIR